LELRPNEQVRGARKPEQPIAADEYEYEYRCAEYEYEYDGERSVAMLGLCFVLSPLRGRYSYS